MKIILLLVATLFITSCATKLTPTLFTTDEHMVVNYNSRGCFHRSSNTLVFHENNVTIYESMNQWNQKIAQSKMGTLMLSEKDKERLNKLFSYYDGKLHDGCTTVDNIEIKRYRKEELISSKNIVDASCGQYGKDNELGFPELISRVRKQK